MFSFLTPYLFWLKVGAIVLVLGTAVVLTHRYDEGQYAEGLLKAANEAAAEQKKLDQESINAAATAAEHQATIAANTQTILKRISANVQKTDACPLSVSYVGLWNAQLSSPGQTPNSAQSPTTPTAVTAVDALNNAALNFGTCNAISQQLTDLQSLLKESVK